MQRCRADPPWEGPPAAVRAYHRSAGSLLSESSIMTPTPISSTSGRRVAKYWSQWLALTVLITSLLSCTSSLFLLSIPTHIHLVLYWLGLITINGHFILVGLALTGWVLFLITWLFVRRKFGWVLWLVPILLLGSAFGYIPSLSAYYDATVLNGRDYYLIDRHPEFGDDYRFVSLCECPHFGLICKCRQFLSMYQPVIPYSWTLVPDPVQDRVDVLENGQLLYQRGPGSLEQCFELLYGLGSCIGPIDD